MDEFLFFYLIIQLFVSWYKNCECNTGLWRQILIDEGQNALYEL